MGAAHKNLHGLRDMGKGKIRFILIGYYIEIYNQLKREKRIFLIFIPEN